MPKENILKSIFNSHIMCTFINSSGVLGSRIIVSKLQGSGSDAPYHQLGSRGVARILHWGGTEAERRRRENRGAEGAERGRDWGFWHI